MESNSHLFDAEMKISDFNQPSNFALNIVKGKSIWRIYSKIT